MLFDLQKATIWKRISACLFDVICLSILVAGLAFGLSALLDYDGQCAKMDEIYAEYEQKYDISFTMTAEEYANFTPEQQEKLEQANEALISDQRAQDLYSVIVNLTLLMITLSVLISCLLLEFVVPLILGNGQTVGKKIFGIAVVRKNSVKVSPVVMFIRTFLGKYTVEIMLPVFICMMVFLGNFGMFGSMLVGLFLIVQFIMLFTSQNHSAIHDYMANTVVVDLSSQRIFDTEEDMLDFVKKEHEESAARAGY